MNSSGQQGTRQPAGIRPARLLHGTAGLLLLSALTLALGPGCARDATDVGVGVLPPSDLPVFFVDTLYPSGFASTYSKISTASADPLVPTWAPTALLMGERQSITAGSYFRFSGFPDSLQGITITSAQLILHPRSAYGDSIGLTSGQYTVYRGRGSWAGDSLTYDSLDAMTGQYFDPVPTPNPGGSVGTDSSGAVILPLDTALVREWFIATIDTGSNNRGMFITAQAANTIWSFWSFLYPDASLQPNLRISYIRNGIAGSYTHTTGFARYLAKIPSSALILDPQKMYVLTGIAYRVHLAFDLSTLPIPVSVNRAELVLSLDSTASEITRAEGTDSLFVFAERSTGSLAESTYGIGIPSSTAAARTYRFDAGDVFGYWQTTDSPRSLVIAGLAENAKLTRFVFHGPSAGDPLKPMLIVTYSKVLKTGGAR